MTRLVRKARQADFQAIYDLQNDPFRNQVFDSPPEPFEQFLPRVLERVESGREHYFVIEEDGIVTSFVWFQHADDGMWFTLLWGKWLRSLVYAAGVTGFHWLDFPAQYFWIRQQNRRMIRAAEDPGYGFRRLGEGSGLVVRDEYPHLIVAYSNCYEILSGIYREKEDYYRKQSLDLSFRQDL